MEQRARTLGTSSSSRLGGAVIVRLALAGLGVGIGAGATATGAGIAGGVNAAGGVVVAPAGNGA